MNTPTTADFDEAPPRPSSLIESLRAFGYDLRTAIADLIDNSISAGAKNVWVDFEWNGAQSTIAIRDDGIGMSEPQLVEAMRLGSLSPLADRDSDDLGRFGLGLKTASFSQCRLLAVFSKHDGRTAQRCWDLDLVRDTDRWAIRRAPPEAIGQSVSLLDSATGTLVVWGQLDRLVGDASIEDAAARGHFYEAADEVTEHLKRTFSDFLRSGGLAIHINGAPIHPLDPFLERHPATQVMPVETLRLGRDVVRVSSFILPHQSKLISDDRALAGGNTKEWTGLQGFYVYRNRRLILYGGWLGLGLGRERHYDLARIRIDIPTSMDDLWQLDVRKSRAHPPPSLRGELKRIAVIARRHSKEIYRHKGAKLVPHDQSAKTFLWEQMRKHGKTFYRLNREHPLVEAVAKGGADSETLTALWRLLEETVPTPLIGINESEDPAAHGAPFEGSDAAEILALMARVYKAMLASGQSSKDARRRLALIEPFDRFPELLETFTPDEKRESE